ncbi:MAG: replication-associated recombination protein A [Bifidobacteriaceae bacterium]|nr:replication-associated recombination protein A [Bifidobacteriaceae bacterium]
MPLAVRLRPANLDELVGQRHLLAAGSPLRRLVTPTATPGLPTAASVILYGPAGSGKTTLAYLVARSSGFRFEEISAVSAGVKDVREVVGRSRRILASSGRETVMFIDEVHRFSKAQQDALLPAVENRWVTLIAATTENPSFSIITPLLSRSLLLTLEPLSESDLAEVVDRALRDPRGLDGTVQLEPSARDQLIRLAGGDARRVLTILEAAASATQADVGSRVPASGLPTIDLAAVETAVNVAAVQYDRTGDQHYDVISAFIKSVRGSDVDAALHYLARMLEAGEDARFIARRLIVLAAEDIGLADPQALAMAVAAAQAVQLIGLPEGRIPLAEVTCYLATAPKSNAAYQAIDSAIGDIRAGQIGQVPPHLRDAHYAGAKRLGHGQSYRYAHDEPHAIAQQQYAPDVLVGRQYYQPTNRGKEQDIARRLERIRTILAGAQATVPPPPHSEPAS